MAWEKPATTPQCRHAQTVFQHRNIMFLDSSVHYLELIGYCKDCNKQVEFIGAPERAKLAPSMLPDGAMIRLPFICVGDRKPEE